MDGPIIKAVPNTPAYCMQTRAKPINLEVYVSLWDAFFKFISKVYIFYLLYTKRPRYHRTINVF